MTATVLHFPRRPASPPAQPITDFRNFNLQEKVFEAACKSVRQRIPDAIEDHVREVARDMMLVIPFLASVAAMPLADPPIEEA